MSKTKERKDEHIKLALNNKSQYKTGYEFRHIHLMHCALPEMDLKDVNLEVKFIGKKINAPLIISGMTGGTKKAEKINKIIAKEAEALGIPFGLGSQRTMLEDKSTKETYYVRDVAPSIPVIGNIGAIQLKQYAIEDIINAVEEIDGDAIAVHLNATQEVIQPEGETDFSGILQRINDLVNSTNMPVIVKETGCGISKDVAEKLKSVGVKYIDVSGRGGTSWSNIEYLRNKHAVPGFNEWGITTVRSILMTRGIAKIIASGGIRSGIDVIKAISIGADFGGAAYPFLKACAEGENTLRKEIKTWIEQMRTAAFLCGARDYHELKKIKYYVE